MIIEHDEKFINYIVDEYSNMLKRLAYQNLKIKSDAEDIVQGTFISLLNQKSFQDEEHLKVWLIRVVINKCHNRNKLSWVRKDVEFEDYHADVTKDDLDIWVYLEQLDVKHRTVLYLHYYEGYKIREISNILGVKQNTVNSQLTRARQKLKAIMEDEYER